MARKLEWINPNKARIETGHKAFDRQCESVSQGQVIGTCQLSYCIRPVDEVECNGHTFPKGHLRQADLNWFDSVPYRVRNFIDKIEHPVILYEFRHWGRRLAHDHEQHKKIVDGYIITTYGKVHALLASFYISPKAQQILDWVLPYLVDEEDPHAA